MKYVLVSVMFALVFACSPDTQRGSVSTSADQPSDGTEFESVEEGDKIDGMLRGRVFAPEGTIPISGALVYLRKNPPEDIPDTVYCDACVETGDDMHTFSNPDGTFELSITHDGQYYLVVQKGAFRRYRQITLTEGVTDVDPALTTLPAKMDKANGDDIPKMAVMLGQYDQIEVSLAKLGLAPINNGNVNLNEASFDTFPNFNFLRDPAVVNQYHIIFLPCTGGTGLTACKQPAADEDEVKNNVQDFVAQGGRLYVTDYTYEFIRQPFPGYVQWAGENQTIGSACQGTEYDKPAVVQDQGLKDWLAAMGITNFLVEANWTTINSVAPQPSVDPDGLPVDVLPKVWVDAQKDDGLHPVTISFEHVCGRALFSTYHTEASSSDTVLLPQEKALLYILLEVGACVGDTPI